VEPHEKPPRGSGRLRDDLLAAAGELAVRPRPAAIPSLRSVAKACGVTPTAVYRHFPSQTALTHAMLAAYDEAFAQAVIAADEPGRPPRERLLLMAQAWVSWALANPGYYQLLFESADELGDDYLTPGATDRLSERAAELLGADPGTAATIEDLLAALHGIASLRIHKPNFAWTAGPEDQVARILTRRLGD
jgi:AcrR family transcriptional regulator